MMKSVLWIGALLLGANVSFGAVILTVNEGIPGSPAVGGTTNQYLSVSWTSTITYENVTIRARIYANGQPSNGTAWLTQHVGPGTQPGSELASAAVTFPQSSDYVSLFTNVTLAPGTWHVILSAPVSQDPANKGWENGDGNPIVGLGVSFHKTGLTAGQFANTNYAPASTWGSYPSLAIAVRGDAVASTPEPASLAITGLGLLALGLFRRRSK
jgi:hypothetical protein